MSSSPWVRPETENQQTENQPPVWGVRDGIQAGLWPHSLEGSGTGGPRGLLRIGYPIVDDGLSDGGQRIGLVNFIAVEPIVDGRRGFSELERSDADGKRGRLFWTEGEADLPSPGELRTEDGVERLSVRIHMERFSGGAQPTIEMEFRADRPGEVRLTASAAPGSAQMDACTLSATMGNYARLRRLWLRDEVVNPETVWPDFEGDEFTEEAFFSQERMTRLPDGDLIVCATSDEADPHSVPPDPAGPGWAYRGSFSPTQYWRKPADDDDTIDHLKVRVNGRRCYWATHNPIPGGLSYENFDLLEPFHERQTFVFGLTRRPPSDVARGQIV